MGTGVGIGCPSIPLGGGNDRGSVGSGASGSVGAGRAGGGGGAGGGTGGTVASVPHVGHDVVAPTLVVLAAIEMPHAGQMNSNMFTGSRGYF